MAIHYHSRGISESARALIESKGGNIEGDQVHLPDEAKELVEPCDGGSMHTWSFSGGEQLSCWHGSPTDDYSVMRRRR